MSKKFTEFKKNLCYLKPLDFILILGVLGFIILFLVFNIQKKGSKATHLKVTSLGKVYLYSLNEDKTIYIPGRLGNTKIKIEKGMVQVIFSPCPNKTCMAKPPICLVGEWIVCLPNEVFLKIEGKDKNDTENIFVN